MKFTKRREFILPGFMLLLGMCWVFFADYLVVTHNFISLVLTASNTYRDAFFVGFVSIVFFVILRRHRKRSEQSEKEYQNLFNSNPVPMWIFDRDTLQFLQVNKAAISHYGYSKAEFLRMTIKDIRPASEQARLDENIRQILTNEENKDTWLHLRKNGEVIIVEVVSTNVDFKNKIRRLAVAHDITAIRMAEQKISKQNQQLRDIAFQASHIVRAPLANIMALTAVIDENGHSPEEKQELLRLIKVSAGQLDQVIKDIVGQTVNIK